MRGAVLICSLYFAFASWTLGTKWLADGSFLLGFLAYALLVVFLVLPPRVLAARWWAALSLALPFPFWWVATLVDEGLSGANLGGILLLHVPLVLQAGLIANWRALLGVRGSSGGIRGRAVQLDAGADGAARCSSAS